MTMMDQIWYIWQMQMIQQQQQHQQQETFTVMTWMFFGMLKMAVNNFHMVQLTAAECRWQQQQQETFAANNNNNNKKHLPTVAMWFGILKMTVERKRFRFNTGVEGTPALCIRPKEFGWWSCFFRWKALMIIGVVTILSLGIGGIGMNLKHVMGLGWFSRLRWDQDNQLQCKRPDVSQTTWKAQSSLGFNAHSDGREGGSHFL